MPTLVKKYRCVICTKKEIVESMVEHMFEGDVPDQSNCDLSTYSDHKISGGKLLANRLIAQNWKILHFSKLDNEQLSTIPGGICDECLANNDTIVSLSKYISFVDEKNLKISRW